MTPEQVYSDNFDQSNSKKEDKKEKKKNKESRRQNGPQITVDTFGNTSYIEEQKYRSSSTNDD